MRLRFDLVRAFGLLLAALLLTGVARAEDRYLDIRPGGQFRPVTIAVTNFASDDADGAKITGIITNNFRRSVFLTPHRPRLLPREGGEPRGAADRGLAGERCAVRRHGPQPPRG